MKRSLRLAGYAALMVVALGAVGYWARGGDGGDTSGTLEVVDGSDDVGVAIRRALGGEATGPMPSTAPPLPSDAKAPSAPLQREAASAGGTSGASGPATNLQNSGLDRKIVQTATMRLQVREVGASFEDVGRIAVGAGGFVASSNFAFQGEQQVASVTVRVPASRHQDVLREIRGLGVKVDAEGSNASDVTEEYSDLSARLRTLEATEAQLLQLLGQARNISEVLQVQDRLNAVRGEIERVKGRMNLLDKLSDLATITVHLRPVVGVAKTDGTAVDLGRAISEAWESSLRFLGGIAEGVLTVVVFSWWVLVLAVPAFFLFQRLLRTRPQEPATAYD